MDRAHFLKLFDHYLKSGENLLDGYSEIIHLSWHSYDEVGPINQEEYLRLSETINHPILVKMITGGEVSKAQKIIAGQYGLWLKMQGYDNRRLMASVFTSSYRTRNYIFKLYGKVCLCCGSNENITLDHVVPIVNDGDYTLSNLQPLCKSCNSKKGSKTIDYRTDGIPV